MSKKTTLQYGGETLDLLRSDSMIAVRPQRGAEAALPAAATKASAHGLARSLGGFELLSVDDNDQEAALATLRSEPSVATGMPVYHTSDDGVPFVPTGGLYVVFRDEASEEECRKRLAEQQLEVVEIRGPRAFIVRITDRLADPVQAAAALQEAAEVSVAEPDLATPRELLDVTPFDELLSRQWHLRNQRRRSREGGPRRSTAQCGADLIGRWGLDHASASTHSPHLSTCGRRFDQRPRLEHGSSRALTERRRMWRSTTPRSICCLFECLPPRRTLGRRSSSRRSETI